MAISSRKLLPERPLSSNYTDPCVVFCDPTKNDSGFCPPPCLGICPSTCPLPPEPKTIDRPHPNKLHNHSPLLISMIVILASTFLLVVFYVIYTKFASRRRAIVSPGNRNHDHHHDFADEEQGPMVDNPIWYIATVGLQPSIINSISVCKFRKSDGLVEGTDCAVCLNEFQEDESLRLLPKCNHAFHIPCIDTWLRSRTNCPVCRAPIISNAADSSPLLSTSVESSSSLENSHVGGLEIGGSLGRSSRIRHSGEEGDLMRKSIRRTVSVDFDDLPNCQLVKLGEKCGEAGVQGDSSSSSSSIVKKEVSSLKRSMSCSGKIFSPKV
ncbi:hypothetical protein Ancab_017425 [Ancistrocladus abbreviatus]